MPYQTIWVEPELALEHNGVKVYHVYKDDDIDQGTLDNWFTTSRHDDESHFEVRDLEVPSVRDLKCTPPYIRTMTDPAWVIAEKYRLWKVWQEHTEPQIIRQILREAIDLGLIKSEDQSGS